MKPKKPYKDLIGQRFGRLTVVSLVEAKSSASVPTEWICRCDCGNTTKVRGSNLLSGGTKSCGCLQKEIARNALFKHGDKNSRLYTIWCHMRHRCECVWEEGYPNYGGRGISVCSEWRNSYEAFKTWAHQSGYSDKLTIERIDVNGNYCPANCRWATPKEQNLNKRNTIRIEYKGETKTQTEWAEFFNCRPERVCRTILELEGRVTGGKQNETHPS